MNGTRGFKRSLPWVSGVSAGQNGDEAGEPGDRQAVAAARRRPGSERPHRLRCPARRGPRRLPRHAADFAGVPSGRERGGQRGQPSAALGRPRGPPARRGLPPGAHGQSGGASQQEGSHRLRPGEALQETGRRQTAGEQQAEGGRPQRGLKPTPFPGLQNARLFTCRLSFPLFLSTP